MLTTKTGKLSAKEVRIEIVMPGSPESQARD